MGVVNTFKTCKVLEIKVISSPIPISWGVSNKLADKNSKGPTPLSSIINEGSMSLACSLTYFSLPLTCSIIIVVT